MDQDTEIIQKPLSTTKEYTRESLKNLILNICLQRFCEKFVHIRIPKNCQSCSVI